jgi:hypothetical protein
MPLLRQTGPLRAIALALIVWAFAGCAPVARALSRPGLIVQEIEAGRIVLHRAACAHDTRTLHMHCHARVLVRADGRPAIGKAATASGMPQGYGPADLRSAYGVTFAGNSATVIAIIDAYGYPDAESDLATYRAQFGLPPCTAASGCFVRVNQRGGSTPPPTDLGWAQEQALDIEMASAMCPDCRILLIEADDDNETNLATAVLLAVARGAAAISNSYGGAEHDTRQYARTYQHPGIAITASAGDSGYGTEFPASTPFTIAVGGTRLVNDATTLRGWRESVWTGTGSGCSAIYPKPGWQTDPLCTRRMMNDVAAVAAPGTGVAVYGPLGTGGTSGWMVFGGTSVGAPLVAGIYAAAGARPTGGRSLWLHQGALNDVTRGTDGACGGTYFCAAQTGYDGPSGNGTPRGKLAL